MNEVKNLHDDLPLSAVLGAGEPRARDDPDNTFDDPMPAAVGLRVRLGGGTRVTEVSQETTDDD